MTTSKTKINLRMRKKTNPILVKTIYLAKKNEMIDLASALAAPTRQQAKVNLGKLNEVKGTSVIIPGKVLSSGEINKKMKVYALGISENAKEKLKKAGGEFKTIYEALVKKEKLDGEIIK